MGPVGEGLAGYSGVRKFGWLLWKCFGSVVKTGGGAR